MKFKLLLSSAVLIAAVAILVVINPFKKSNEQNGKLFEREKENHSVALDALQFLNTSEAYPNKQIPADAYVKAMHWYAANKESMHKAHTASTSWISMGPVNMGGRTVAIAIDPTDTAVIWLGSASGGLWKSTTGGIGTSAWTYVPLGYPVLGVSSITLNPLNHNELYIGTGEVYSDSSFSQGLLNLRPTRGSYGMGLFKSMDGGKTWSQSINWTYQQNRGIWKIVINPLDTNIVYAATTNGVYKSTNGGGTWTQVLNVPMAMDLQIHNVDTNILLCGVGNYGTHTHGVYRTTNGGASWTAITAGLPAPTYNGRVNLMENAHNNDSMYAHISDIYNSIGIYLSTDKGATWSLLESQDITNYQGWYAKGMLLQPGNPNNMLAGGIDLWSSTNGGASFTDVIYWYSNFHSDIHDIVANPLNPNMVYIITDGGLYRSNDFGNSFYPCGGGYNTMQEYIGAISSTDTTVLLSGQQDNYVIKYSGNQNWTPVIGGDGCYTAIDHTDDYIEYGAYQYLNVYRCTDQGLFNTATQILTSPANASGPNSAAFLAPYILCYSNTNYIYAGGQALQLSVNGGVTWNYMGNNPVNGGAYIMTIAASYTNTDSIYFATASDSTNVTKVFFSANEGTTLTDITAGLPNRYPRRLAVNPQNSKEVYIAFSGFGGQHLFKSTNAGGSWTDISTSLPDVPFECVTVDPLYPNYIYAGCDFGVFYSPDKGTTWYSYDNGFPDATMVFDLIVSPSDRYLYGFTYGRGVFKRSLSDIAPTGVNNISAASSSVKIYPNPTTDDIHITMDGTTGDKYVVYIYDMQGKQVRTAGFDGTTTTIPVGDLARGVYTLSIIKDGGSACKYQKFIKE